jgi:GcvH upstream region-like protein
MLAFFRKYQRYFFLMITIVIVISFSFFGTYSTLMNTSGYDQTAFTAIDGTKISKSELDQLILFISTDAEDKMLFGGLWGYNFLNDGVIKKDFFQTGLAEILASAYAADLAPDLKTRQEKEKRYVLYTHPQAKFVGVETAWNYLAPEIKTYYDALKSNSNATSSEALKDRINLFIAEKKLPAPLLKQVLLYQQQQYGWLSPDPNIERMDFSLFDYHTLEDWFGSRFIKLIAEFILNASILAEEKGYRISKEEAYTDLLYHSELSYKQMLANPHLGVANSAEFFNEQLRRMQLDQSQAADIWKKVMLFRRWFNDVGNSVFVDTLMFEKFDEYASEKAYGDLYRLPPEFRFGSFKDLQQFETYLNAISKQGETTKNLLTLPSKFYTVQEVAKNTPELVQKSYLLEVAKVDQSALQAKVGVKETWNWEVEDAHWQILQKQFADLGTKMANSREERFNILDSLDDKSRAKIDAFARKSIIDSHPEWLDTAFDEIEGHQMTVKLLLKGEKYPFQGLKDPQAFMKILDKAKLGEQDPALAKYTFDGSVYYRILVKDRSPGLEILTFAEARQENILDPLVNKKLEAFYPQIREKYPSDFQKEDKTWKPFQEVKLKLADLYFANILKAIRNEYAKESHKSPDLIDDITASLRFYPYLKTFLEAAKKDPKEIPSYLQSSKISEESEKLMPRAGLEEQWKLLMTSYDIERGSDLADINLNEVFKMPAESWSDVQTPIHGDLSVFFLKSKLKEKNLESLNQRISIARSLLSDEAKQVLMEHVLQKIKEKKAISLDTINSSSEIVPES